MTEYKAAVVAESIEAFDSHKDMVATKLTKAMAREACHLTEIAAPELIDGQWIVTATGEQCEVAENWRQQAGSWRERFMVLANGRGDS